jgi:hypothetical protein
VYSRNVTVDLLSAPENCKFRIPAVSRCQCN